VIYVTSVQGANVVGHVQVDCSALEWLGVISGWYHIMSSGDSVGLLKVSVKFDRALMSTPREPEGAGTVGACTGPPSAQLTHRSLVEEEISGEAQQAGNEVACNTWLQGGALQDVMVADVEDRGAAFGVVEEWSKAATRATSACVAESSGLGLVLDTFPDTTTL
jgi:hypothetical protein